MQQIDLRKVRLTTIRGRKSKVDRRQLSTSLCSKGLSAFVSSLPDVLKAADLKLLIAAMIQARRRRKPILWMYGAHVIKVGLSPILCEILTRGMAQQISTNNAGLIHDLELAFFGHTSEDVEAALLKGEFGMSQETGDHYRNVTDLAARQQTGLGEAAGKYINSAKAKYRKSSPLAVAQKLSIPATIHVAIGTDIVGVHPGFNGADVGAASQIDFKILCHHVTCLKNGGVVLNFGSAVIMPEVFLKAMSVARNLDRRFGNFTAANFDMIGLYRPQNNFVRRPRLLGATTFDFAGHHEIMLPLLWGALSEKLKK